MLDTSLPDHVAYLEFGTQTCIELTEPDFDIGTEAREHVNSLK